MIRYKTESEKLIADYTAALSCPNGNFYPDKEYGSFINEEYEDESEYLLTFARHALNGFDGVFVRSLEIDGDSLIFNLLINNDERQVTLSRENDI
ncbi:MAG: hypothetical protein LUG95_07465 [Clostridiales bacterium]|nr:hypothetical protein [Clostridiales bacterium]